MNVIPSRADKPCLHPSIPILSNSASCLHSKQDNRRRASVGTTGNVLCSSGGLRDVGSGGWSNVGSGWHSTQSSSILATDQLIGGENLRERWKSIGSNALASKKVGHVLGNGGVVGCCLEEDLSHVVGAISKVTATEIVEKDG